MIDIINLNLYRYMGGKDKRSRSRSRKASRRSRSREIRKKNYRSKPSRFSNQPPPNIDPEALKEKMEGPLKRFEA